MDGILRGHVRRRVVVTGMGVVSPLGNTLKDSWRQILGGNIRGDTNQGATSLEETLHSHQDLNKDQFDREWKVARSLPCQVAAPVRGLREAFLEDDEIVQRNCGGGNPASRWNPRTTPRFVQMALLAGSQAMRQANLTTWLQEAADCSKSTSRSTSGDDASTGDASRGDRFGVCVGSGMSAVREIGAAWDLVSDSGVRRLSPHFVPRVLANSAAGRLALEHGLRGPNLAPSTACAASAHAIGDAVMAIRNGASDLMLAGGSEASIEPLGLAGFCRLRALSTAFNDQPKEASRPFDARRDGFVMGEGAALLILEELEHAKERIRRQRRLGGGERTPRILAEVTGYAATGDAFHVTAPDEAGRGAERAMLLALEEDRRLHPSDPARIGYVNAHATSTPKGDEIEADVVDRVLRSHQHHFLDATDSVCYMSSTKGMSGHLLGAAGALEAALTVMSLVDQRIPNTLNLDADESGKGPALFAHISGDKALQPESEVRMAISNSFGFGGTNASLVFRKYEDNGCDNETT